MLRLVCIPASIVLIFPTVIMFLLISCKGPSAVVSDAEIIRRLLPQAQDFRLQGIEHRFSLDTFHVYAFRIPLDEQIKRRGKTSDQAAILYEKFPDHTDLIERLYDLDTTGLEPFKQTDFLGYGKVFIIENEFGRPKYGRHTQDVIHLVSPVVVKDGRSEFYYIHYCGDLCASAYLIFGQFTDDWYLTGIHALWIS